MRHRVARPHETAGVQRRHPRGEPRAGSGTVEPAGRDDDRVPRHLPYAAPRLGDLDDAHSGDLRVLRVYARQLLARRRADQLADARQLARLGRLEREPERGRIGDRVPHAAERDVDRDRAEPVDLERRVDPVGEARHVRQLDRLALARPGRRRAPRRRRRAPRAAASSPARASRPFPSRAARSRRRSCSSPTSPGTRSAP